jgi:anti-anti-sigma factor
MFCQSMELNIEQLGTTLLVAVTGRLDSGTAPVFDAELAPFLASPRPNILLDFAAVTYVSSAGLRSILQLVKYAGAHHGRVGISGAPAHVMEVVEISGFPSLLDIYPDRAAAIGQLAS